MCNWMGDKRDPSYGNSQCDALGIESAEELPFFIEYYIVQVLDVLANASHLELNSTWEASIEARLQCTNVVRNSHIHLQLEIMVNERNKMEKMLNNVAEWMRRITPLKPSFLVKFTHQFTKRRSERETKFWSIIKYSRIVKLSSGTDTRITHLFLWTDSIETLHCDILSYFIEVLP